MEYIVKKEKERIDSIVFEYYGNYDNLYDVLEINAINIDISEQYLPVGTTIYLPEIDVFDDDYTLEW